MTSSDLWSSLSRSLFSKIDDGFISDFRKPGGANSRLGAWDAYDSTMRYFKFMLYSVAERETDRFFSLYRGLGNVDIGAPVSVRVRSCEINIDYLLSVQEFMFLESATDLGGVQTVVEIGAGFGRTCHALLGLQNSIERYTIVDLPEVLELSRRVLARAVPEHFHKIDFIAAGDNRKWQGVRADLAINIDSFQEMLPETINSYMQGIIRHGRLFYVRNPVAKYDPACIGVDISDPTRFKDAFSLGYCRKVVDIFDEAQLSICRREYLDAYRPADSWDLVAEKPLGIFPYYHHALYRAPR